MSTATLPSPVVVRAPSGQLDLAAVGPLRAALAGAAAPGSLVLLDMEGVTSLSSSALGVVLQAESRLAATGGALELVRVGARVMRVLRICGLAHRLVPAGALA